MPTSLITPPDAVDRLRSLAWKRSAAQRLEPLFDSGDLSRIGRALRESVSPAGSKKQHRALAAFAASTPTLSLSPSAEPLAALWRDAIESHLGPHRSKPGKTRKRLAGGIHDWLHAIIDAEPAPPDRPSAALNGSARQATATAATLRSPTAASRFPSLEDAVLALNLLASPDELIDDALWLGVWLFGADLASEWSPPLEEGLPHHALLIQQAEIPWRRGLLYAPLRGAATLRTHSRREYRSALTEACDSDGMPHHELIGELPAWTASLLRGTAAAAIAKQPLWNSRQDRLLSDCLAQLSGLCRTNGSAVGSPADDRSFADLLEAGLQFPNVDSTPTNRKWLSANAPQKPKRPKRKKLQTGTDPRDDGSQSDWAQVAWLRHTRTDPVMELAVWHGSKLQVDWSAGPGRLGSGEITFEVSIDGRPRNSERAWECVCWHQDGDVTYLEHQTELDKEELLTFATLFTPAAGRVLVWATVSSPHAAMISLNWHWPAEFAAMPRETPQTRQWLADAAIPYTACPISLPMDLVAATSGRFGPTEQGWRLEQSSEGAGLFSGIVFHVKQDSGADELDWQAVTVTEAGRIVGPDVAAAVRLSSGAEQWLIYRSLRKWHSPRAVLGCHTTDETLVARLARDRSWDSLLEVEGEAAE